MKNLMKLVKKKSADHGKKYSNKEELQEDMRHIQT